MKDNKNKKRIFRKIVLSCFVFCFVSQILFIKDVYGFFDMPDFNFGSDFSFDLDDDYYGSGVEIDVSDEYNAYVSDKGFGKLIDGWTKFFIEKEKEKKKKSTWSKLFHSTLGKALNTIAYDTATWIGSGGKGQKPLFITEGWREYKHNIMDNAAGNFIETLGREGPVKFNLCEPDFAVKKKIGAGLVKAIRPNPPECTFSKMTKNWNEALHSDDFLTKFQDMFDPASNDLNIALTLQTGMIDDIGVNVEGKRKDREETRGWLDLRNIDGLRETFPGAAQLSAEKVYDINFDNIGTYTGDALVDAFNIFINQLSITALDTLMKKIGKGKGTYTHPYDWGSGSLTDFEAGPSNSGIAGAENKFRELLEPKFNVRGDYSILAELTMCSNPNKAGPTNCVIEDKFRQAIESRVTVGDAIEQGYLNYNGVFGFAADNLEPVYKDLNYPYRSMIILRKFRIIPVGWELAAEYIKDNFDNIDGMKSLGDLIACYDNFDKYEGYYSGWCNGLVDPNWVLKAPLNYCKREGYGPQIISEQITGQGYDSELSISRDENYCADEQSCIKENSDGSCEMYGYCTEEKRKWNFNTNSCDPNYNTCQTFRSKDGKTVSYLENTLDYGICNIDNVGCQKYSVSFSEYNSYTDTVNWDGIDNMYFDKDVEECDVDSEGCHEFIRTKAGFGANLLINSSFEEDLTNGNWDSFGTQNNIDSYISQNSLELTGNLNYDYIINPIVFSYQISGESFNLSFYAKDCGEAGEIQLGSATVSLNNTDNNWQYFSISNIYPLGDSSDIINFQINNANSGCKIDGIKLERGNNPTEYSDYRQNGLVYEKLLPDYLEDSCYENAGINYQLKDNMPAICNNFTHKCNQNEAGCNMYTSVEDNINIPARVLNQDYCPSECESYDNYLQQKSVFDSLSPAYFIPKTAQTCGAESVGCDEFTNLDKIEEQGEQIEYYSYLRQCRKPDDQCLNFYTWEGSNETGYQLRSFNLQGDGNEPAVTEDDSLDCNETIYNLSATDSAYNSDCREFYNTTGDISYHLYKRTISCSDNCHPHRRTKNNIVKNLDNSDLNSGQCDALQGSGSKEMVNGQCIFCKNGGIWNDQHQSCIYMAIPDEGVQCSATADGCREYSGNSGNNMRIILNNDFEGSIQNWEGNGSANLSSDSLMVGGESLEVSGGTYMTSTTIGYLAEQNKSYYLTFIAKTGGASFFTNIGFNNGLSIESFVENPDVSMAIGENWKIYKFNLASLEHEINDTESLFIQANGDFFIDNIRLIEITDRYYLIKDSWNIPGSCYKDIYGNSAGEIHNLGCSAYSDKDDKIHYLRQFSNLCQESAVGCELMIDTHNYSNHTIVSWNGPGDDLVEVDIDNYIYVVYDQEKECNNNDQGCGRFGKVYKYENDFVYGDVYLKNNPNEYNKILCEEEAINCEEWLSDEGANYFKNPKNQICEWRQLSGEGENSWDWFKKKMKYCDSDSDGITTSLVDDLCLSSNDCGLIGLSCQNDEECGVNNVCVDRQCRYSCILDNNNYDCPVNSLKTFGYGGNGNVIYQPIQDLNGYWAGICSADESGCSEYIDPISKFNTSMIFNSSFFQDADNDGSADGWNGDFQDILLKPKTLYMLAVNGNNDITVNSSLNVFRELNNNNLLGNLTNSISVSSSIERASKIFYVVDSNDVSVRVDVTNSSAGNNSFVELKKVIIEYQKKQEVDKETCNGIVNSSDGCVLFNERVQNGLNLANSVWDADLTFNDSIGISPNTGIEPERDANTLIKVTPDRECNNWLACRSYVKNENDNNVCFDVGLCDSFDVNGNCGNFVLSRKINQTYPNLVDSNLISDMSGYVKVGYQNGSLNSDYYSLGAIEQSGEIANVPNGGFEWAGNNGYPLGWLSTAGNVWNSNIFNVVNNPYSVQKEGIGYAPEGRNFLKLGSVHEAVSEWIEVVAGVNYVITAYMNTVNLYDGIATLQIREYNNSGVLEAINNDVVWLEQGNKWTYKSGNFLTGNNTSRIEIVLGSNSGTIGNFYFDDIKIRSVLEVKETSIGNYLYTPQTCRLYPENDSLSCDYYEESWARRKGWLGYCLEYDRYPGSPDTCLLWWPTDKINGEGIEEGAGYDGNIPVYYCAEARRLTVLEYRRNPGMLDCTGFGDDFSSLYTGCPSVNYGITSGSSGDPGAGFLACAPTGDCIHECTTGLALQSGVAGGDDGWYEFDGFDIIDSTLGDQNGFCGDIDNVHNEEDYGVKFYDPVTREVFDDVFAYCTKIVQTVSSVGENKYWSGRVYEGSNYIVPTLGYEYDIDQIPFGAIVEPFPINNPYEWDGSSYDGIQPLYLRKDGARASHPYRINNDSIGSFGLCQSSRDVCLHVNGVSYENNGADCIVGDTCVLTDFSEDPIEKIRRLFAQSYGTWEWNGNHYIKVSGDWMSPTSLCAGGVRPDYFAGSNNDICANPPQINNIRVNNIQANIILSKNGFVNLAFNSLVDSQQLPLVMYFINWGDNENMLVSGVEMRDRSNANNPHLVYHLYSYWDLKAKHSVDQTITGGDNSVYCGNAGNLPLNYSGQSATGVSVNCPNNNNCCVVKPSVKIKDNWGWCNNGGNNNICPAGGYEPFNNWIIVTEH